MRRKIRPRKPVTRTAPGRNPQPTKGRSKTNLKRFIQEETT